MVKHSAKRLPFCLAINPHDVAELVIVKHELAAAGRNLSLFSDRLDKSLNHHLKYISMAIDGRSNCVIIPGTTQTHSHTHYNPCAYTCLPDLIRDNYSKHRNGQNKVFVNGFDEVGFLYINYK